MTAGELISSLASPFLRRKTIPVMPEYDSFESALQSSDSYQDPRLIEIVFEKTKLYREQLERNEVRHVKSRQILQNMFVLSFVGSSRQSNVLEIGGACGSGYFEVQQLLPGAINHWAIVETEGMANAGRRLGTNDSLSFHADLESASGFLESRDLTIAQGMLQYAGDPLQVLRDLFSLNFDYLYVSRTVVLTDESPLRIFTKQTTQLSAHGPGTLPRGMDDGTSTQPMVLVDRNSLLAAIPSTYKLLFVFEESEEREILINGQTLWLTDLGFLAQRISTDSTDYPD